MENIRNFCIIAHIDHGKSTLADRMLEITGTIARDKMKSQLLDSMDIERERGITIKLQPVKMVYQIENQKLKANNQNDNEKIKNDEVQSSSILPVDSYILNLIDTPGHVDFSYEVSRSLAAVEGAILLVDATQGIQAQTLANAYLAVDQGLTIIPVINKIDLPQAQTEAVAKSLTETFGFREDEILTASAKTGEGVEAILQAVVDRVPSPKGNVDAPLKALIFDSHYDKFKGVVCHIRIIDGKMYAGKQYGLYASQSKFEALEVGFFNPGFVSSGELGAGSIGYVATGLKDVSLARVGDTIYEGDRGSTAPLPGYKTITPMVFAGLYPVESQDYPKLRQSLEKLKLNDASLTFEPESSKALGFGMRCGFLGLLHLDVVRERLEREYDLDLIISVPSVQYSVELTNGTTVEIAGPAQLPDRTQIAQILEPIASTIIMTTEQTLGSILELINGKRGEVSNVEYMGDKGNQGSQVKITASMPLAEIITNFFDELKSISSGYASLDYEVSTKAPVDVVRLDILVSGEIVDALARLVPRGQAEHIGRELVERLKEVIPRQQYEIPIQAAIGAGEQKGNTLGKIIARSTVKAYRKDVTGYLYGGDRTRKDKLLEKQKAGKKRMKQVGKVTLPQEAFFAVLKQ